MKKLACALGMLLALSLFMTGAVSAYESSYDYDTMVSWEISIPVPEDASGVFNGGNYYIYPQTEGSIPYVMVREYEDFESEEEFVYGYLMDIMQEKYSDLQVTGDFRKAQVNDRVFYEIDYGYTVDGYTVVDKRVVKTIDGKTYMFASKEIPELRMTVGGLLWEVTAFSVFLRDGEPIADSELGAPSSGDEILAVNWEDVEEEVRQEGVEGSFVQFFEVGYEMFLPDNMYEVDVPEGQEAAETYIGLFITDTEDAYAAVQYIPTDITLDEYEEFLYSYEYAEDVEEFMINGNLFVLYFMPEADTMNFATQATDGLLEFIFYPDDGDFSAYAEIMGASIRKFR